MKTEGPYKAVIRPGMTPREVAGEMARYLQSLRKVRRGGRPRSKGRRCPCGVMTLKRAKARAHHCEAVKAVA